MQVFYSGTPAFSEALEHVCRRGQQQWGQDVEARTREVLERVRERGDCALLEYTQRWDGVTLSASEIELPKEAIERAIGALDPETAEALETAAERIRAFHRRQVPSSWEFIDEWGNRLGQRILPLDRVGVYVPGGKAAYPSCVLMNVLPARVAGVREILAVTPPAGIRENPAVLAAMGLAGVDRIFQVGGAQAVAALAYGTETIPRVDKIIGPGNIFVTTAKRLVFGTVDIDMIAGPSEILIVADGHGDPVHVAVDLLAQAEHDEQAWPLLVCTSKPFLDEVSRLVKEQLAKGPWERIASASIKDHGMAFWVTDLEEACELVNRIAPEHLELAVEHPEVVLEKIRHAGAIFIGPLSAVTLGDYLAGPNHVLPTSGTARFFSPLGVYDFVKRSSIVTFTPEGLNRLGPKAAHLARTEGLHAHAESLLLRIKGQTS